MFYCWTRNAALSVANKITESDSAVDEVKVCTAALRLILQILNWEFQCNSNGKKGVNVFSSGIRRDAALSNRTECVLVQVRFLNSFSLCATILAGAFR